MSGIVAGFVTSHATALMEPGEWDAFRHLTRERYRSRFNDLPPEPPQVAMESDDENERRYARVRDTHDLLVKRIEEIKPDAVILLGNDQNENFKVSAIPQFAIYTGSTLVVHEPIKGSERTYSGAPDIALSILSGCVERGFDVARTDAFVDGKLAAHAHSQVFMRLVPNADVPVIPIFVNAITPPLPSPRRCFEFGRALADTIAANLSGKRIVIGASGGLSHFTAGYPYEALKVKRDVGTICTDFDRKVLDWVERGELSKLGGLSPEEILDNGDVEFRQGIAFLGALAEGTKPSQLVYEPIYRALTGFWAGYWDLS